MQTCWTKKKLVKVIFNLLSSQAFPLRIDAYNWAECPKKFWLTIFIFVLKIIRLRNSQQKEKKKSKTEENDDKSKNQIRIFLYQLYPIFKIKNSKIINFLKKILSISVFYKSKEVRRNYNYYSCMSLIGISLIEMSHKLD